MQNLVPVGFFGGEDGAKVGIGGGIVDHNVQPPIRIHSRRNQSLGCRRLTRMSRQRRRLLRKLGVDGVRHRLHVLQLTAAEDQARARAGISPGNGRAHAARSARYNGHFTGQVKRVHYFNSLRV